MKNGIYFIFIFISINSFGQKPLLKTTAINSSKIEDLDKKKVDEAKLKLPKPLNREQKKFPSE